MEELKNMSDYFLHYTAQERPPMTSLEEQTFHYSKDRNLKMIYQQKKGRTHTKVDLVVVKTFQTTVQNAFE